MRFGAMVAMTRFPLEQLKLNKFEDLAHLDIGGASYLLVPIKWAKDAEGDCLRFIATWQ